MTPAAEVAAFTVRRHPQLPGVWLIHGPEGRALRRRGGHALLHFPDLETAVARCRSLNRRKVKT